MIDFSNVTDIMLDNTPVEQVSDSQGNVLWSAAPVVLQNYFYVEDVSGADNTVSITKNDAFAPTIEVFCSTDQQNWTSIGTTSDRTPITATVPANGKLYLKCTANAWSTTISYSDRISASSDFAVGGYITSLLDGDGDFAHTDLTQKGTYTFYSLFYGATYLVDASQLVLPDGIQTSCYRNMFKNCTSLTTAPTLPATTLADYCYQSMFEGCTALTTAPALPATTLASNCYTYMFYGCTSLTTAPVLPATTLASNCYAYMFRNCTALTQVPALPATTLTEKCYNSMFNGCSSLNSVTSYAQDISATSCTSNWLNGVAATGDFYNLGGATYTSGGSGIPSGWTEHNSL